MNSYLLMFLYVLGAIVVIGIAFNLAYWVRLSRQEARQAAACAAEQAAVARLFPLAVSFLAAELPKHANVEITDNDETQIARGILTIYWPRISHETLSRIEDALKRHAQPTLSVISGGSDFSVSLHYTQTYETEMHGSRDTYQRKAHAHCSYRIEVSSSEVANDNSTPTAA